MTNDNILALIVVTAFSFVAAFASGINMKANKKGMTMLQLVAEIMVHAISGIILGLIASRFTKDMLSLGAISAASGLIGQKTVYFAWSFAKVVIAGAKKVDLKEVNKEADKLENKSNDEEVS